MFPGQQLEMDAWKPTVAKDVPHPTLTRNVMYTMCMDVPYYVRSLTSAFNCTPLLLPASRHLLSAICRSTVSPRTAQKKSFVLKNNT